MVRTRANLLDAALRAVAANGTRRTTMGEIAALAGVAKATLYNHFRTKDEVWSALVIAEIDALARRCAGRPLADALAYAATALSEHPALRRIATDDPVDLIRLLVAADAPSRTAAREAVRTALAAAGSAVAPGADDLVLRWLSSHITTPGSADAARAGAAVLAAAVSLGGSPDAAAGDLRAPVERLLTD